MYVKMFEKNQKIKIPKGISIEIGKNLIILSNSKEKIHVKITKAFKASLGKDGSLVLGSSFSPKKTHSSNFLTRGGWKLHLERKAAWAWEEILCLVLNAVSH